MRPNAQLMELYGTDEYYLEKTGAIPPGALRALQAAAPVAFMGWQRSDAKRQQRLLEEAEMMNQMLRAAEAERMRPIHMSQGSSGVYQHNEMPRDIDLNDPTMREFERSMGKLSSVEDISSDIGRQLAQTGIEKTAAHYSARDKLAAGVAFEDLTELEKEAFGGAMFGKALGFLGKGLGKAGKGTGALGEGGGFLARTGEKMRQAGVGMRQKGLQMRGVKPKPVPTKPRGNMVDGATAQAHKGEDLRLQHLKGTSPFRKPGKVPTEAPAVPTKSAPIEAASKAVEEGAKKSKGLGWKTKATLGLAAAGTGYVGLKGTQAARDYMMVPSQGGGNWGRYGGQVPHGVNRYGVAQQRF